MKTPTEDTPVSERKWTKGPEWIFGIMGTDAADAHAYRRDIDADRGRGAMEDSVNARSVVSRLYEALHQLTNASEYLINRVVETKGVRCVDDTEAAIKLARAALQRADGKM